MPRDPYRTPPTPTDATGAVRELVLGDDPDVRALLAAGAALVAPTEYVVHDDADEVVLAHVVPDGYQVAKTVIPAGPKTSPDTIHATVRLDDLASWSEYVNHHASDAPYQPHVYADQGRASLTAILDPASPGEPSWARHRATLTLKPTSDWQQWLGQSGQLMPQEAFAAFVEEQAHTVRGGEGPDGVVYPDAARMLEVAENFRQNTKVSYESAVRMQDGQRQLVYVEESTEPTAAGRGGRRSGNLRVPDRFRVAVQVWERIPVAATVEAMFRWRITSGNLSLGYKLVRAVDAQDKAWQVFTTEAQHGRSDPDTDEVKPLPEGALFVAGQAPTYL